MDVEHFHHHKKFCWTALLGYSWTSPRGYCFPLTLSGGHYFFSVSGVELVSFFILITTSRQLLSSSCTEGLWKQMLSDYILLPTLLNVLIILPPSSLTIFMSITLLPSLLVKNTHMEDSSLASCFLEFPLADVSLLYLLVILQTNGSQFRKFPCPRRYLQM